MANNPSSLRFDHREVAVIFSLFIFVSLLMFTVGVLVGKGLTMAKFEGRVPVPVSHFDTMSKNIETRAKNMGSSTGTSVTTGSPLSGHHQEASIAQPVRKPSSQPAETAEVAEPTVKVTQSNTTELSFEQPKIERKADDDTFRPIPKPTAKAGAQGSLLEDSLDTSDLKAILDNPEIKALLEDEGNATPKRDIAARKPISFSKGKYTVQVASYPSKTDADSRAAKLKALGYEYAFVTAKKLANQNTTWYRVWLGYYPSQDSAKRNADILQRKGEVKNYLVRKSQN